MFEKQRWSSDWKLKTSERIYFEYFFLSGLCYLKIGYISPFQKSNVISVSIINHSSTIMLDMSLKRNRTYDGQEGSYETNNRSPNSICILGRCVAAWPEESVVWTEDIHLNSRSQADYHKTGERRFGGLSGFRNLWSYGIQVKVIRVARLQTECSDLRQVWKNKCNKKKINGWKDWIEKKLKP